jgi:NAD-dependent SIR2 family protein deacetylase
MDKLAHEKRLLHHITQNFDCVEQRLPALEAKTVRLHGRLNQMRCQKCNQVCELEPELLQRTDLPGCLECIERSRARSFAGKRPLSIGRLKPDVLLCGEPHPDDSEIVEAIEHDLAMCPDLVLVVGTKLERHGPRSMATRLCKAARRRGGAAVWISKEDPALLLRPLFDYILKGDCDAIASTSVSILPRSRCSRMLISRTHVRQSQCPQAVAFLCLLYAQYRACIASLPGS